MIITCPFCQTRFLVAAHLFASGPRQMRCAKCKHSWKTELLSSEGHSEEKTVVSEAVQDLPQAATGAQHFPAAPIMPPQVARFLRCAGLALFGIFILWFILDRQAIAEKIGFLEPLYTSLGLRITHVGEGLRIEAVRSELVYEDGIMKLAVEGKIANRSQKDQLIPPLHVTAIGPDGSSLQDWQIDPPAAKVAPGSELPFRSSINAPKGTVVDINLNFVEIKQNDHE